MRMTASWLGSNDPTAYKSVARRCAPMASSPRILNKQAPTRYRSYATPVAVHRRSACSGVKALRNTSDARRQAAKLCYRFGPLTPSARSANLIAGDGMKNGFPAPNKELAINQKQPLDTKSPIQVRIHSPPALSHRRTGPAASRLADLLLTGGDVLDPASGRRGLMTSNLATSRPSSSRIATEQPGKGDPMAPRFTGSVGTLAI